MSTFTDWNGPQGSNIRASDLVKFADAYAKLSTLLDQHIAETTATNNVHSSKDYVDSKISEVKALIPSVSNLLTQSEAANTYALKSAIPTDYAKKSDITSFVTTTALTSALSNYLKTSDLSSQAIIKTIQSDISSIETYINSTTLSKPVLEATDYIKGLVYAVEQIQFTDKYFNGYIGGSDDIGVYYILGMLQNKAGTAYIKYANDKPFSACVNFAVTPSWKASMSVLCDNDQLANLKFLIVSGTGADGSKHAYLAVQSTDWIPQYSSSDGKGMFSTIAFEASGINFIPVGSDGFSNNNAECTVITECYSGEGLSSSSFVTKVFKDQNGKKIFEVYVDSFGFSHLVIGEDGAYDYVDFNVRPYLVADGEKHPFLTTKDLESIEDTIGVIMQWPKYSIVNDVAVAKGFNTDIYLACDGSSFSKSDYPELYSVLGTNKTPVIDYCIIKAKAGLAVGSIPYEEGINIEEAIAKLHGIQAYDSKSKLPDTAKTGTPAIVRVGDKYYVYVKTADGWEDYSTTFDDTTRTVHAIASVIAASHNADVYTVYNSYEELPYDQDVEVGSMAVVFSGNSYTVYKYNGTTWEVQ